MSSPLPPPQPQRQPKKSNTTTIVVVIVVLAGAGMCVLPLLIALLLPAIQAARHAARQTQDQNNARQVVLALLNYDSEYGSMPPAFTTDEDGNPLLSWRVAILPFLEQQALYDQFHHDEPWDSPHNRPLSDTVIQVYQSAAEPGPSGHTNIVGVMGQNTMFRLDGTPVTIADVRDGTLNTIFIVQVSGTSVPWAAPGDLELDSMAPGINDPTRPSISSQYRGAVAAYVDGHVEFLDQNISPQVLRSKLIINDGQ